MSPNVLIRTWLESLSALNLGVQTLVGGIKQYETKMHACLHSRKPLVVCCCIHHIANKTNHGLLCSSLPSFHYFSKHMLIHNR